MSREDITASMDRYEDRAYRLTYISLVGFVAGAAMTGYGVYLGAKGNSGGLGVEVGLAAVNYGVGAFNLTNANRNSQKAAALRGALAQHELASGATEA